MEVFRDYLELKLGNESFFRQYYGECAICPITVKIIKCIDESPRSASEIAKQCGISEHIINNLREADDCCMDSVRKIAAYFHLSPPKNCLKNKAE